MKRLDPLLTCAALLVCAAPAMAVTPSGLAFTHNDWELACDNTRTCRAAGYQPGLLDGSDGIHNVSVLLTRKAGPGERVHAELQLGNPGEDQTTDKLPDKLVLTMRIDGRSHGTVSIVQGDWIASLTAAQTDALLAALVKSSSIEWSVGEHKWQLSDAGATAVLLKMDEFQGRLGTPGALVRKGAKDERGVLPPLPLPVVEAAPVPKDDEVKLSKTAMAQLRAALGPAIKACRPDGVAHPAYDELQVRRLSTTKLLASTFCWNGAYNEGYGYWVVNTAAPYAPLLVTTDGTDYADGTIGASHKGRGVGDCWGSEEWTWDGRRFVHTAKGTTGMCRGIAAGGAWSLPVHVSTVRRPPAHRAR